MNRINRIELELDFDDQSAARARMERMGDLRRRLIALLDRLCTEVIGEQDTLRVDRLELDLGHVDADVFDDAFMAKLEPALRSALAAERARSPRPEPAAAALELIETFALTGSLPWWADARDDAVVALHFGRAASSAPAELAALLRRLAADQGAMARLAKSCGNEPVIDVVGALAETSAASEEQDFDRNRARGRDVDPVVHRTALRGAPPPKRLSASEPTVAAHASRRPLSATEPTPASARALAALPDFEMSTEPATPVPPSLDVKSTGATSTQTSHRRDEAAAMVRTRRPAGRVPFEATPDQRHRMLARLDEVYVDDAGLVLLWPFFGRYFARTGLLNAQGEFHDESAQLQAVALASMLTSGTSMPVEHRLPLAKLLCGRPLASDFWLDRELTTAQLSECEVLLCAAMDHVPSWGVKCVDDLRSRYLRRPGALTADEGAWLLRVEGRPHDAALAGLSWSYDWIRLPWMPDPLRVQW